MRRLRHTPVNILGIWDGHDAGAALFIDGRLAAAVNEERFTRRKLEIDFPRRSIAACLDIAGITPASVAIVACTTDDVAKAIGRLYPPSKEAYYRLRRRQAPSESHKMVWICPSPACCSSAAKRMPSWSIYTAAVSFGLKARKISDVSKPRFERDDGPTSTRADRAAAGKPTISNG